jgi:mRNA interferase YafQ
MRTIERTTAFERDYKRVKKGPHGRRLDELLTSVVSSLANDEVLAEALRDHALRGPWADHRDCHVKPDLVLIYRKPDENTLQLVHLGSHHELFGK